MNQLIVHQCQNHNVHLLVVHQHYVFGILMQILQVVEMHYVQMQVKLNIQVMHYVNHIYQHVQLQKLVVVLHNQHHVHH